MPLRLLFLQLRQIIVDDYFLDEEIDSHNQSVFIKDLTISGTGEVGKLAGDNPNLTPQAPNNKAEIVITGNVTVEEGVTAVGENAFVGIGTADGTLDVSLPDSITSIGKDAFAGVNIGDENKIVIPDTVTSVGDGSFAVVKDENGTPAAGSQPGISITIPGNAIGKGPCAEEGQGLDDIFLPSDDSSAGTGSNRPAFFEDVTITAGTGDGDKGYTTGILTGKDDEPGANAVDIVIGGNLDLGDGLTEFDGENFANVGIPEDSDGTLNVTIPGEGTSITGSLSSGPKVVDEDGNIITGTGSDTGSISFGSDEESMVPPVDSIGDNAFADRDDITVLVIPANMTHIGAGAFADCDKLTTIIFEGPRDPENPLTIDENAFSGCSNLNTIKYRENGQETSEDAGTAWFPEGTLTELPDGIFAGTGFDNVILTDDINTVSDTAFDSDKNISVSVTVPVKGFMSVDGYPANGEYPLDDTTVDVTFKGTWPDKFTDISATVDGKPVTVPEKYGYEGTWTVNGETITIGEDGITATGVSVSDMFPEGNTSGGNGGEIDWEAKSFKLKLNLPEGWTVKGSTDTSITIDTSLIFGEEVPSDFFDSIKDKLINTEEGHSVDTITIEDIIPGNLLKDETLFDKAEGGILEVTPSITGKEISYSLEITTSNGDKITIDDIDYNTTWGEIDDGGNFYYSATGADEDGKILNPGSLISNDTLITEETVNGGPYYQYAKIDFPADNPAFGIDYPESGYYLVGTEIELPATGEHVGFTVSEPIVNGALDENGKVIGSSSSAITQTITPHEYSVTIDGDDEGTVTFGGNWSAEMLPAAPGVKYSLTKEPTGILQTGTGTISAGMKIPGYADPDTTIAIYTYYHIVFPADQYGLNYPDTGDYLSGYQITLPDTSSLESQGYTVGSATTSGILDESGKVIGPGTVSQEINPPIPYTLIIHSYNNKTEEKSIALGSAWSSVLPTTNGEFYSKGSNLQYVQSGTGNIFDPINTSSPVSAADDPDNDKTIHVYKYFKVDVTTAINPSGGIHLYVQDGYTFKLNGSQLFGSGATYAGLIYNGTNYALGELITVTSTINWSGCTPIEGGTTVSDGSFVVRLNDGNNYQLYILGPYTRSVAESSALNNIPATLPQSGWNFVTIDQIKQIYNISSINTPNYPSYGGEINVRGAIGKWMVDLSTGNGRDFWLKESFGSGSLKYAHYFATSENDLIVDYDTSYDPASKLVLVIRLYNN